MKSFPPSIILTKEPFGKRPADTKAGANVRVKARNCGTNIVESDDQSELDVEVEE